MRKLVIIGAGSLGREIKTVVDAINAAEPSWELMGFIDDGIPAGTKISGFSVLGNPEYLNQQDVEVFAVIAIGSPKIKKKVAGRITNSAVQFATLIHPNVVIGDRENVHIAEGSIITAGCILTTNITVGSHVLLNLATTVGHGSTIGNHTSVMPGTNISGDVHIGESVYVGTGTKFVHNISIASHSVIGAGATVISDISEAGTYVGVPAEKII